jgi:NAD(P)H-flavin reductase
VCEILLKQDLTPVTKLFEVRAPDVARKAQPGQFVIVRIHEKGERIPLTVADYDRQRGVIQFDTFFAAWYTDNACKGEAVCLPPA